MTIERQVASEAAGDYIAASERWVQSADAFMDAELHWFERAWSCRLGSPEYERAEWESREVLIPLTQLAETRKALRNSHDKAVNALDELSETGDQEFLTVWRDAVKAQEQREERTAQVLPSGWLVGESGRRLAEDMRNHLGTPARTPPEVAAQAGFDAKYGKILGLVGMILLLALFVAWGLFLTWSLFFGSP